MIQSHPSSFAVALACLGVPALAVAQTTAPVYTEPSPLEREPIAAAPSAEQSPLAVARAEYRPGKGLTFTSADESFDLAMRLRAQFLYTAAHRQKSEPL